MHKPINKPVIVQEVAHLLVLLPGGRAFETDMLSLFRLLKNLRQNESFGLHRRGTCRPQRRASRIEMEARLEALLRTWLSTRDFVTYLSPFFSPVSLVQDDWLIPHLDAIFKLSQAGSHPKAMERLRTRVLHRFCSTLLFRRIPFRHVFFAHLLDWRKHAEAVSTFLFSPMAFLLLLEPKHTANVNHKEWSTPFLLARVQPLSVFSMCLAKKARWTPWSRPVPP